jgi:energy-coupling factor transporter ATP-binding protein EcfA2
MELIKRIEIRYLRSIHRLAVPAGALTVLSGANDVGKSNILKALNLFFNNQVDWQTPLDFYRDFSLRRLNEVRRESIKGRQFIRIDVEFARPPNYKGSLPPTFTVTRTWLRDSLVPEERNDLERQERRGRLPSSLETARRMLSRFLSRVRFQYVPAIRDRAYFEYVLQHLQETMLAAQMKSDDPILTAVGELNATLRERAATLRDDFERATGIDAYVSQCQHWMAGSAYGERRRGADGVLVAARRWYPGMLCPFALEVHCRQFVDVLYLGL